MRVADLPTPALVVDAQALTRNLDEMATARPGERLRPHIKAHKCTNLALEQAARGHRHFTCATPNEVVGLARAGLGTDLLLANESVDRGRLQAMANCGARVTVAVDADVTVDAAASSGLGEVLIDVNVGMPRCGCEPGDAARLAERARSAGLNVRGVMGYEGHAVLLEDRARREAKTDAAMAVLAAAADAVGGDVVSAGGTGTFDLNQLATEIQAGSYALMDTAYAKLGLPFTTALRIVATVIHADRDYVVADAGLKAQSMDHGNPTISGGDVWFCSDEHITFAPSAPSAPLRVGDRVFVQPAHVDPTVALHERIYVADGPGMEATVIETWPVDLRGWDV